MPSTMLLATVGGVLIGLLLLYAAYAEYREERAEEVFENTGKRAAGGVKGAFTLSRGLGFASFLVIQTGLAEIAGIGMSLFDLLGPVGVSNVIAVVVGTLGLAGVVPVSPWWYAGVMLMLLGFALSTPGRMARSRAGSLTG